METTVIQVAGWIPAVIIPSATILQMVKLLRTRDAGGVSIGTWLLFTLANVSLYIYTEKYAEPQAVIGLLGTALVDVLIVILCLVFRRQSHTRPAGT